MLTRIQLIQFIALFFLSISSVSTEQWQLHAMNMKATKIARGNPLYWWDSQFVLGEIKAVVPVHDEEPREDQIILQQYFQQVESLSPENRLSKFCKEAGFLRVVEVGQYFVTEMLVNFSRQGLSRIHPSTRRPKLLNKRVDPRKYENWTCIRSHGQAFSTSSTN